MKISLLTLGCRTNQAESLDIEHALLEKGHQIVDFSEHPDLCVINTCTVTAKADYQSRQLINRALKKNIKVIVTGCHSELNREKLKGEGKDIELVRNSDKMSIINMINNPSSCPSLSFKGVFKHRPSVKVQDGCNYSCSYCAIPSARGRSLSISSEEVIEKINYYESVGCHEIVLTGIHLGTYGLDLSPRQSLSVLLKKILTRTKIPRIRLSSLEVKEIGEELLELFSDPRVCNHLHVPLQSGDDNILKLMNRTYTVREYRSTIERILVKVPGIALGTDIIAGFPGEGDDEFHNILVFIEEMPFSYLHVFPYSRRPGTKAYSFSGHVPESLRRNRAMTLRDIGARKKKSYIEKNVGKVLDIIIEERKGVYFIGTTRNYIKVSITAPVGMNEGMLVNIGITAFVQDMARGIPINL